MMAMSQATTPTDRLPVMLVDDDAAIREVVEALVQAEGYAVVTASDGSEALTQLHSGLRPGVILLDLRMPGMDGQTFREIQKAEPALATIPVVIVSGDRDGCRVAASLGTESLLKPFKLDDLLGIVRRFCDVSPHIA
jgi:CheY-like chemotaxis protein